MASLRVALLLGAATASWACRPFCDGCEPLMLDPVEELHERTEDCMEKGQIFAGFAHTCLSPVSEMQASGSCEVQDGAVVCTRSLGACFMKQTLLNTNVFKCPCDATTETPKPTIAPMPFICDKYTAPKECTLPGQCYNPETCKCEANEDKFCWGWNPCWRLTGLCSIGHTCIPHTCNSCSITCEPKEGFTSSPGLFRWTRRI
eukprot:TRINITY_DN52046_c0_g1_i1.p1 TRINITY_DN52046_c0_g1~~TRINITY_DN52046_c0_g1_i1.p1  ORF type:complete len:222 (+),score=71.09 TRINITY_DN52046_c0_g1_i1:58-666(+)